ncbi:MBL fold metallo-hydrolase [Clostridia bacterium]|nr:MBL fold metallo-hydrolase [Clostridia bacterium]
MRFCPIVSGSSGNCTFVSIGGASVLVDAGLSGVAAEERLLSIDTSIIDRSKRQSSIDGILVTHEHGDHIQGVGVLSRKYDIPVFATRGTWKAMDCGRLVGKIADKNKRVIAPNEQFTIKSMTVVPFTIPHDAESPVGYSFFAEGRKAVVATDIGEPNDYIIENLKNADVLLIESNHDLEMLERGRYPEHLKKRISGKYGHLSNAAAGRLICDCFSPRLSHIFLAHLSEENNRPLIALDAVSTILRANNIKMNCENGVRVTVAERYDLSDVVVM